MQAGRREKLLASIKSKDTKVVRVELPKCRLEDEMFISDIITLRLPVNTVTKLNGKRTLAGQFVVQERDDTTLSGHFSSFL